MDEATLILLEEAEKLIQDYMELRFTEARDRLVREMNGEGCGCRKCRMQACDDATSWENFALDKEDGKQGWRINANGSIERWIKPTETHAPKGGAQTFET